MQELERGQSHGGGAASFSIRHPVTVCMALLALMVLGFVAITKIPLVLQPNISFPFLEVYVPYPNASPGQVLESIAKPVEEALATIPGVQRMSSFSGRDSAWINLEFGWGHNVELLRTEIRDKLDQIRGELPSDADRTSVQTWGTNDFPVIEGSINSPVDLRNAQEFIDTKIRKPLLRVPGVADVEIWGSQNREVEIYLRLDDVLRHGVDVGSLFRRLNAANVDVTLGPVLDGGRRFQALRRGTIDSFEQIRTFPVNAKGVQLHEVADILFDVPRSDFGRHLNGKYAVGFGIRKASEANTVETVDRVKAKLEEMNSDPSLRGANLQIWFDSGHEIVRALSGLLESGIVGSLLSLVILFLFLPRLGPTLAISFSIPFSMIAAVGFLYMIGKSLNVLSMMGLMLASGMLVDNAVVVMEAIYQKIEKGEGRIAAAVSGTRDVLIAVVASTLTSIIIFIPLVFGKETNYSVFLSDTGASIMISLICSLFVSLTFIPLAVARILGNDMNTAPGWVEALGRKFPWKFGGIAWYQRCVGWALRRRFLTGAVLVPAVFFGSMKLLGSLPDNSPDAQDLQDLNINYEFTENYHYKKIEQSYVAPVEAFLLGNKPKFMIKDVMTWYSNNNANTRVYFDKDKLTLDGLKKVREEIQKGLPVVPGANINLGRQEGAQSQTWLEVNLYGDDATELMNLAREAKTRLKKQPGFVEVHTDADRGQREVQIRVDRTLARKYGVSPQLCEPETSLTSVPVGG
ncbi:MAG: efflux RND transporter permease subunit [Acidobacteria bacterium]|nr:efflux RND transporter permease subunit [Acidobacteriota bacterium]